jgi:hypothetical protein
MSMSNIMRRNLLHVPREYVHGGRRATHGWEKR